MRQVMTLEEQEVLNSYLIDEDVTMDQSSPIRSLQDMAVFIMLIDAGMHQDSDTPVKEITWIDYYTHLDLDEESEEY